eukprot:gb/GEZN01010759.1/.p1 GENE.gb/GEZN01010759.1/~~gb/GEZN01010759.1/.p1  ORF type:complete len:332 (+),score=34.32 gb/GEZN01010759.1/:95-1090(+)
MHSTNHSVELELASPPSDGISSLKFGNRTNLLLVSSWDKGVRMYDAEKNALRHRYDHKGAVLDVCFSPDDSQAFSGGIDRNIVMSDLTSGRILILGSHEKAVKCVVFSKVTNLLVSGSWDCSINLWDPRANKPLVGSYSQADCKVYSMDINGNNLLVGTSGRKVHLYDIRNMSTPQQIRESSLMNQTRCVRFFPDGSGYALSSIEGRVSIEYLDPDPAVQRKKYAFKCHRKSEGGVQTLYPVNAIAFHPVFGTFATGGCDGFVLMWDYKSKKRICQYPKYHTSIASLDFNHSGSLLAVASSYTFEQGPLQSPPPDKILIRTVQESEVTKKK